MAKIIEKRRSSRQKTFLLGRVEDMEVVVVDISDGGAQLFVDAGQELPKKFDLHIQRRRKSYRCELLRRDGDHVGVRFLAKRDDEQ